ncbi:hypothetical protein J6590_010526 [Homalodisca vitripennis]|nr:hypothetical protein J6590_010526 [Homalodisca vitripennis]
MKENAVCKFCFTKITKKILDEDVDKRQSFMLPVDPDVVLPVNHLSVTDISSGSSETSISYSTSVLVTVSHLSVTRHQFWFQ